MNKGIDKQEFWQERLERAKELDQLQFSVYEIGLDKWVQLEQIHKTIVGRHLKPADRVLDAGCGYGRASQWFPNEYVGVDFSAALLEEARAIYPDKTFIQADLKDLPFKDKEFDLALCVSVRQMVEANLGQDEWLKMQKEVARVAKKVLILEYGEPQKYELIG